MRWNFSQARPLSSACVAIASPPRAAAVPASSSKAPASAMARCRKSCGASGSHCRTDRTSRASSAGPMPRPTGCKPSVSTTLVCNPNVSATLIKSRDRTSALSALRTFAVGPTGRSMTRWVEPAAIFFDSTEAISCPSVSRSSARSTRMSMSSAGLSLTAPPHTTHPPSRSTTRRMAAVSSSTGAMVSMVSAVPAGDVIARDEVFGIIRPSDATIATMIGVVRLPGSPPALCLSTTMPAGHRSRSPTSTIAWVSARISL